MHNKNYIRLGSYIEPTFGRNVGNRIEKLLGVNTAKQFIPSIANTIGTNMANYKVVKHNDFVYVPDTSRRGDKIAIAKYDDLDDCIVSQAYTPFRVKDVNMLNPDYLMMWFKRTEFDRYARFHSHGSVREIFSWDEMCNVSLPVPDIKEQRRIVAEYKLIEQRIANNNQLIQKLEATAQAIYHHTFVENIDPENLPEGWKNGKIVDIATAYSGKSIMDKQDEENKEYNVPVAGATGIIGYSNVANQEIKLMTTGRVGTLGVVNKYYEPIWAADNVIVFTSDYFEFTYQILNHLDYNKLTKLGVQSLITKSGIENYNIVLPPENEISQFEDKVYPISEQIRLAKQENNSLIKLKYILLSKLS